MRRLESFSEYTYQIGAAAAVAVLLVMSTIFQAIGGQASSVVPANDPWADYIVAVDEALAARDQTAVRWGLEHAYGAALGSRRWEGMIDVGDAAVRIDDVPRARQAYLAALFRAREQRSLEGVLSATEAFARLGDRQVVEQGLGIALEVAGRDPAAVARVTRLGHNVAGRSADEAF